MFMVTIETIDWHRVACTAHFVTSSHILLTKFLISILTFLFVCVAPAPYPVNGFFILQLLKLYQAASKPCDWALV